MSILHFNNRDYKIRKYDVYEEEDSVITQFVAEVILPDNLKTPEVWQAIEYLKASGYFFEVHRLHADGYCYTDGTLLDAKHRTCPESKTVRGFDKSEGYGPRFFASQNKVQRLSPRHPLPSAFATAPA